MIDERFQTSRTRVLLAAIATLLVAAVLVMQLVRWMVWSDPKRTGLDNVWFPSGKVRVTPEVRGNILDRDGALLVTTGYDWDVSVTGPAWEDPADIQRLASRLAPLIGSPEAELFAILSKRGVTTLVKRVDYYTGREIQRHMGDYRRLAGSPLPTPEWRIPPHIVRLDLVPKRVYPEGSLAAHVLGCLNAEHEALHGVEKAYDEELRGQSLFDITRDGVPLEQLGQRFVQNASPDGAHDIILTIDRAYQYVVERALQDTIAQFSAAGGTVIVMEPKSGAILASASWPTFEPARYGYFPSSVWDDPAVSAQYEPGSIFKVITMAAGLNAGVITRQTTYYDTGCITINNKEICNLGQQAWGTRSMDEVLLYSLNLGSSHVSRLLGKEFYAYVERFGFGQRTGVDLYGEIPGSVRQPTDKRWSEADLCTHSYGQGLAVTPIQMVTAISAVANKGFLPRPHIVAGIVAGGKVINVEPPPARQVIRREVAATLTDMLVSAVDRGAEAAQVAGYSVAGKSGTAEIPDEQGYTQRTIAGYVGYLPAYDPAFVILVKIVEPKGEVMGAKVAAPTFGRIAEQLVAMAGIPPDRAGAR